MASTTSGSNARRQSILVDEKDGLPRTKQSKSGSSSPAPVSSKGMSFTHDVEGDDMAAGDFYEETKTVPRKTTSSSSSRQGPLSASDSHSISASLTSPTKSSRSRMNNFGRNNYSHFLPEHFQPTTVSSSSSQKKQPSPSVEDAIHEPQACLNHSTKTTASSSNRSLAGSKPPISASKGGSVREAAENEQPAPKVVSSKTGLSEPLSQQFQDDQDAQIERVIKRQRPTIEDVPEDIDGGGEGGGGGGVATSSTTASSSSRKCPVLFSSSSNEKEPTCPPPTLPAQALKKLTQEDHQGSIRASNGGQKGVQKSNNTQGPSVSGSRQRFAGAESSQETIRSSLVSHDEEILQKFKESPVDFVDSDEEDNDGNEGHQKQNKNNQGGEKEEEREEQIYDYEDEDCDDDEGEDDDDEEEQNVYEPFLIFQPGVIQLEEKGIWGTVLFWFEVEDTENPGEIYEEVAFVESYHQTETDAKRQLRQVAKYKDTADLVVLMSEMLAKFGHEIYDYDEDEPNIYQPFTVSTPEGLFKFLYNSRTIQKKHVAKMNQREKKKFYDQVVRNEPMNITETIWSSILGRPALPPDQITKDMLPKVRTQLQDQEGNDKVVTVWSFTPYIDLDQITDMLYDQ